MNITCQKIKQDHPLVEKVYDSLQGMLCEPLPFVENAFAPGSVCGKCYSDAFEAYRRLCDRLGVQDEDEDVEIIINSLQTITDELCYRMFAYGAELGNKRNCP